MTLQDCWVVCLYIWVVQVDAVDSNGLILPVSMWVKKLEILKEPRCLCVMEPVERTVATVKFNTEVRLLESFL